MSFEQIRDGKIDPTGSGRMWAGQKSLSSGSVTIDYSSDLPGVEGSLPSEPVIEATAEGDDTPYINSIGTSQAVIADGSGSNSHDIHVVVHEQGGD